MIKRHFLIETSFIGTLIISALFLYSCGGGGSSSRSDVSGLDNISPTVVSTSPPNGAENVFQNAVVTVTFSEAIQEETISPNTFIVRTAGAGGGAAVPGTWSSLESARNVVVFTPAAGSLAAATIYNITITTEVKDLAGNRLLESPVWTFTTGTGFDNSPPSFTGNDPQLTANPTGSNSIALSWNAANDSTPASQLSYVICQSTAAAAAECLKDPFPTTPPAGVSFYTVTGTTSYSVTGLTSNTTYLFVVRARDLVNLMDGNTAQKSAKTFGVFAPLGGTRNTICGSTNSCINDASDPSVTMIGNTLYLVWAETNNIYVRTLNTTLITRSPVSIPWLSAAPINTEGGTARWPRITSNKASTAVPYVTYTGCNPSCSNIYVKKWNGSSWENVGGSLNVVPAKAARDSAITFNVSGVPYVVWAEEKTAGSGDNQIYVAHLNGTTWSQDSTSQAGGSLNFDTSRIGANPSIAIDGATVKVAWTECPDTGGFNCNIYIRTLQEATWSSATPFKAVADSGSRPEKSSLTFADGILYAAWFESGKVYVRNESNFSSVGLIGDASSSKLSLGTTSTASGSQIPYLVFADKDASSDPSNTHPPRLFVKRWDGKEWVFEGEVKTNPPVDLNGDGKIDTDFNKTTLNMTDGAAGSTLDSSITFLQGTPYVAWREKGVCKTGLDCGGNDNGHFQVYVKRLE